MPTAVNPARALFGLLLGRRRPTVSGTIQVQGIEGPVLIRRDRFGIPCIEARDDHDAWFGLGFCQGQDRAWQLEALLRVVRGTLAALIGADGLPVDRVARRIGWRRSAQSQLEVLGDSERAVVEAFAAGVTQGVRRGAARRSHEFTLLRSAPTPYEAADVLGISKLMAFVLSSNWDVELARLAILSRDGPGALACVDPAYGEWAGLFSPEPTGAPAALHRLAEDIGSLTSLTGMGGGSNNWVIGPARTGSGGPIVASDPHLEPILPNHWYLAHVRTPGWALAGAALAGTPTFAAGHNGNVAWGITAGLIDNTDLFIEEVGPDGRSVRGPDGFVACRVLPEVIEIKGSPAVEEPVLITPRGPIVGAALEMERWAISMSATWLEARPITGLFKAPEARSSAELRAAMDHWPTLPLNLVLADTGGSIGWQLMGDTPRRRSGVGVLPLRGWDPDAGWEDDPLAFEELPGIADPDTGWIATANNKPQGHLGAWLGVDWADHYRLQRIGEVLDARRDWDLAGVAALQLDLESLPWRKLRDVVLAAPVGGSARRALSVLARWDGRVDPGSPGAAVFELFIAEMARRVAEAKAPQSARWALGAGFGPLTKMSSFGYRYAGLLERLLIEQPAGWFEGGWPEELAGALETVTRRLQSSHGDDPAGWAWGRVRRATMRHPLGERRPLDRVFNLGPWPCGGDPNTVSQAGSPVLEPESSPLAMPTLRMAVEVGDWDHTRFVLAGGQSGNPLSPHYDDLFEVWRRGGGVPIAWSRRAVASATVTTLRLSPD